MASKALEILRGATSVLLFAVFGLGALAISPLMLVLRKPEVCQRVVRAVWRPLVRLFVWTGLIAVERGNLPNAQGTILVANHPSLIDVVLLLVLVPRTLYVAKHALKANPFVTAIVRATAGRFEMSEGALVEARRCGMLPGYGPGRAVDHNHGASYGGRGYAASYGVYGKERWPVWPGGAGTGSAGPSLVWIEAGRMSISGRILANGAAGGVWTCSAAGGGIFLVATSAIDLAGATVDARSPNVTVMLNEPAGGGRIAIWSGAPVVTNELTVISADAGKDLYNDSPHEAGNGTVYYGTIGGFRILVR